MALVPEFISVLRDIRDNKYKEIVEIYGETIVIKSSIDSTYNSTLALEKQTEQLKNDTYTIYNDTYNVYQNTKKKYDDTVVSEAQTKEYRDETEEFYELTEAMSSGLGFSIHEDGHMIVTMPENSNINTVIIDVNGHMIIELL